MAKFSFRLQGILNLKVRLENQQRNVFSQAKKQLDEEEEKLNRLKLRRAEYEEEGRSLREKALNVQDLLENVNAIERMNEYIDEQTARVIMAEREVEKERAKLVEMMQERKMYERLRERALEEYFENEKHEEGVINDEHNSFVYSATGTE